MATIQKFKLKPKASVAIKSIVFMTAEEEIEHSVNEWYKAQKRIVPTADLEFLKQMKVSESAEEIETRAICQRLLRGAELYYKYLEKVEGNVTQVDVKGKAEDESVEALAKEMDALNLESKPKGKVEIDLSVKPEFGTPAFWAWARAVRAKKDAERAAAGLPPLPTKKEKEAAKAAKAAAKAAKVKA